MEINVDSLSPRRVKQAMQDCLKIHLETGTPQPFFLHGPPGVGKSDMVEQLADSAGMDLEVQMLTQIEACDMRGLTFVDEEDHVTVNYPPVWLPQEDDPPTIIFLDELPAAEHRLQVVAYQLLLSGRIGQYELAPHHYVCGAGNRVQDGAVAYEMGTALASRLIHFNVESDIDSWLEWASKSGIHPAVMTYVKINPHNLHTLQEQQEADQLIGGDPRRWHKVSNALNILGTDRDRVEPTVQGLIGKSLAMDFFLCLKEMEGLPEPDRILTLTEDQFRKQLPDNEPNLWGLGYSLVTYANDEETMAKATRFFEIMVNDGDKKSAVGDVRAMCMEMLLKKAHEGDHFTQLVANSDPFNRYLDESDNMAAIAHSDTPIAA